MAKKILQRYLPSPEEIKKYSVVKRLGERIHDPNLWHLNRRSVATAVAIGLFVAFIPLPGQMLLAAFLAFYLRGNMAIAVVSVWVSNPVTIPPFLYASYMVGHWLIVDSGSPSSLPPFSLSWEWFREIIQLGKPLILGSLILGAISSALGYLLVRYLWRWHAIQTWKERGLRRKKKNTENQKTDD
jgi:uncharacterized protein (DUF2062 family)